MDNIHEIINKPWINYKTIDLKLLTNQREAELMSSNVILTDQDNSDVADTDNNEKELLAGLNKFAKESESELKPHFLFNSNDERTLIEEPKCELKTYQLQLEHAKRMISDRSYKVNYLMKLRTTRRELLMRHLALLNRPIVDVSHSIIDSTMTSNRSIIPILVIQTWPQPNKHTKVRLEKEILFRADQCLTELRDQFKCQRDYGVPIDLSEDPEQAERIFRGELFKSGFFLINDTFYNDMRDPNNIDLSSNIIEWASKEVVVRGDAGENVRVSRGIGPFKSAYMENHKFEDLQFKLGCPYLYLHQGDCEHLFTISDIRYVANNIELQQTKFPFVTATSIGRKTDNLRCYMCKNRPPHWYTRNNSRLPIDPFFFCENCFYSFNYDKNKKKVGQFQAYLYTSAFGIPDSVVMAVNSSGHQNVPR